MMVAALATPRELLTASRQAALLSCPRRHYWRYEIGLVRDTDAAALRFGTAWHAAMEARWGGADYDTALAAALGTAGNDALPEDVVSTLAGLLAGYYARWETEPVRELHPEVEFRHPLKGSRTFDVAGKIDGLGVLHDGRLAMVEHKTTAASLAPDSDYWLRLRFNPQVLQYVSAARLLGWSVETVLYDVTRKPAIRVKQGESAEQYADRLAADCRARPDFYFARREVPVLDADLEEFAIQRREVARMILNFRAASRRTPRRHQAWPRNLDEMRCRSCDFASFCLQNLEPDLNKPPAGFRVGLAHPELEAAPA